MSEISGDFSWLDNLISEDNTMSESEDNTMREREREREQAAAAARAAGRRRERRIAARIQERQRYMIDCDCQDCRNIIAEIEQVVDREIAIEQANESGEDCERYTCSRCSYEIITASEIQDMIISASGDPSHFHCFNFDSIRCEDCGLICGDRPYHYYQTEGGRPYCNVCFDRLFRYCYRCEGYESKAASNGIIAGGIEICGDCLQSIEICEDCGEIASGYCNASGDYVRTLQIAAGEGDPICNHCQGERREREQRERDRAILAAKIESGEYKKVSLPSVTSDEFYYRIRDILQAAATRAGGNPYAINITDIMGGNELTNKRGKIAKRIKNNMRREHGIALDPAVISEIGNLANNYSLPAGEHVIEITDNLADTVGNFGDSVSCFRPGGAYHSNLQRMIESGDFSALRLYSGEGEKIGRAWIYNDPGGDFSILFNAYGDRLNKIGDLYAAASESESDRKLIEMDGDIYINSSEGIVFGDFSQSYFEIDTEPPPAGEDCEHCGSFMREGYEISHNGIAYCSPCYHALFIDCERCDQATLRETAHYLSNEYYCEDCESEIGEDCEDCGERFLFEDRNARQRCEDCESKRREQAAAILAAILAGEDYKIACEHCRSAAIAARAKGDQLWFYEIGVHCQSWWIDGCERARSGKCDPGGILFLDCEDCGESGEHCERHYTLVKWAASESERAMTSESESESGERLLPILLAISKRGI